jgi:hypothetical protein
MAPKNMQTAKNTPIIIPINIDYFDDDRFYATKLRILFLLFYILLTEHFI